MWPGHGLLKVCGLAEQFLRYSPDELRCRFRWNSARDPASFNIRGDCHRRYWYKVIIFTSRNRNISRAERFVRPAVIPSAQCRSSSWEVESPSPVPMFNTTMSTPGTTKRLLRWPGTRHGGPGYITYITAILRDPKHRNSKGYIYFLSFDKRACIRSHTACTESARVVREMFEIFAMTSNTSSYPNRNTLK